MRCLTYDSTVMRARRMSVSAATEEDECLGHDQWRRTSALRVSVGQASLVQESVRQRGSQIERANTLWRGARSVYSPARAYSGAWGCPIGGRPYVLPGVNLCALFVCRCRLLSLREFWDS